MTVCLVECSGFQVFLYFLPTDKIYLLMIISIDNGKIFLAEKNGCLHEVA